MSEGRRKHCNMSSSYVNTVHYSIWALLGVPGAKAVAMIAMSPAEKDNRSISPENTVERLFLKCFSLHRMLLQIIIKCL